MRRGVVGSLLVILVMSVGAGCSDEAGNVEQAIETEKKTYGEKRAEGEGVVEAAGDAYDAVLEEGEEKAE